MRKTNNLCLCIFACAAIHFSNAVNAQESTIQYFRPNNKSGLHEFEPTKNDTIPFKGLKVQIGGNFAQDFQVLLHRTRNVSSTALKPLKPGFNLPMANLNVDAQLEDGIRLNLTLYLSTRHHPQTWVKGGYVQLDKLPFLKSALFDSLMKSFTIKAGFYELDYGDSHFRRTDGGNGMYNPFVENYIMDAFATEIGGELYYHPKNGFIAMAGVSNGQMNPSVVASPIRSTPAVHAKLGFDRQWQSKLRTRLTGSFYGIQRAFQNPLYFGDRAGSHYFFVMEHWNASVSNYAWSGRFNPGYDYEVMALMLNPFIKYKGLEFFGTLEQATGRSGYGAKKRSTLQYAADLIYRFPREKENFWIGARYNSLISDISTQESKVTINRGVASIGCFITKNILIKTEYVYQEYLNFDRWDIRYEGLFNGLMVEAAIGF